MATKGGADATLVAAAYRLGQSFKPGDYTEIFKHQYKGLTEAYKAKYKAIGDVTTKVAEEAGEIATTIAETTKKEQEELDALDLDALDIDSFIDTMAEDHTEASIQDNNEHYSKNEPLNQGHFGTAEAPFLGWKEELQTFVDKPFLSKEEKKRQSEILRKVQQHKDNLNKNKSDYVALSNGISEGHVNMQQSFKGDPMRAEKLELTRILMDPNADFDKYGIKMEWKDGKKHITYSPGLLGITNSLVSDSPIITPPGSKSLTITEDELFRGFKYKDKKSIVDHNAQVTEATEAAAETITGLDGTKAYTHKDFNAIAGGVYSKHKEIAMASPNFNDITTREVEVGGTMRIYEKDLPMNIEIDRAVINQMGIGSDEFSEEEWADGKIDAAELELKKHEDAKGVIMEKLLNPKTPSEKEIAASEYGKWWTRHTKAAFDDRRKALDDAKKVKEAQGRYREDNPKENNGNKSKFGLDLTRNYGSYYLDGKTKQVSGQDVENAIETFKSVQDKGTGIFTGYDGIPYKLKNGKWTKLGESGDFDEPANPTTIFTNLGWNNNPKIMEYLKVIPLMLKDAYKNPVDDILNPKIKVNK